MVARVELTGRRFGRLLVTGPGGRIGRKRLWLAQCDCGTSKEVRGELLRRGHVRSCGCLQRESRATATRTHGKTGTTEYRIWVGIKKRCLNPNDDAFDRYGGRGICMCHRWQESFTNFLEDMGPRPGPEYSIERDNNDGDYEPGNCRWATAREQNRNRRMNRWVTARGRKLLAVDWAAETGIPYETILQRLDRCGWSEEDAVTIPPGKGPRYEHLLTAQGRTMSLTEWSRATGLGIGTIRNRIVKSGWSVEDAVSVPVKKNQRGR